LSEIKTVKDNKKGAKAQRRKGTVAQRHGLQPSKGTDYKSAPAESEALLCELGEAKSAPAESEALLCELGEAKSAQAETAKFADISEQLK
jgi:hypothetical protein